MQFIKPNHIQRLLKLKTPEDIQEWREERRANFPTKAKREASNELRRDSNRKFTGEKNQYDRQKGPKFNGEQRNSKFGKTGKLGQDKRRFNNGLPPNKRPFVRDQPRASSNEPNKKEARLTGAGESSGSNEQDNDLQNRNEKNGAVDSDSLEQSSPANDASRQTDPSQDSRTNSADQRNRFRRRRQPTLLEKMLLIDVKRNEEAIFQCIQLIVDSNYLSDQK